MAAHAHLWNRYPPVNGTPEFRAAAAGWLTRRFELPAAALDPDRHVLPLAGTKEGLYLLPSLLVPEQGGRRRAGRADAGPVYAVYYGAAVMAGAEPVLLPATAATGFLPDLEALPATAGPDGTALSVLARPIPRGPSPTRPICGERWHWLAGTDFVLAVDECYSELWDEAPPPGALAAALADGGARRRRRLPFAEQALQRGRAALGLRRRRPGGAGRLLRLRAYASPVQPLPLLAAATALWGDEAHVEANRALYRAKFDLAQRRLGNRFGFYRPAGGFFLWLDVGDGEAARGRL